MDRRTFLIAAACGILAAPARAAALPEARIGLILPLTGERGPLGRSLRDAALLSIDQANRERRGRRTIVAQMVDCRSDPGRFEAALRHLMVEERAISAFAPLPPGQAERIHDRVGKWRGLVWDPAPHGGGDCPSHVIHGGPDPRQSLWHLIAFARQELGPRFLVLGGEPAWRKAVHSLLAEHHARAVGDGEHGRDIVDRIRADRPDVILSLLRGEEQVALLRTCKQAGLDPRRLPIASPTLTEAVVRAAGPGVAAGHVAAQTYFTTWRSRENASFLFRLRQRHGGAILPLPEAETIWWQIQLFAKALDLLGAGDLHPVTIRESAKAAEVAAPQGRVGLTGDSLGAMLWPKIAVAEPSGRMKILARTAAPVGPGGNCVV